MAAEATKTREIGSRVTLPLDRNGVKVKKGLVHHANGNNGVLFVNAVASMPYGTNHIQDRYLEGDCMSKCRRCIRCGKELNCASKRRCCGYFGESYISDRSSIRSDKQRNIYEGSQFIGGYVVGLLKGLVVVACLGLVALVHVAGFSWSNINKSKKIDSTYVTASSGNSVKSSQQRTSRYGNTVGNELNRKTDDYYCKYCRFKPSGTDGLTCYSAKDPYLHSWLPIKKINGTSVTSSSRSVSTSRQKWSSRYGNTVGNELNRKTDDYYCKYCRLKPSLTDGLTCYSAKDPYLHVWLRR